MIIAIPFAGQSVSSEIADVMIASCRRAMPGTPIWQLSDMETPQLKDTDHVVRRPLEDWVLFFLDHMINLPNEEVLRLDYDVIVQRDVREVFSMPFDIALTRRPLNDLTSGNLIRVKNPHNHGVIFIRNGRAFFQYAKDEYLSSAKDGWMDCSIALENAAASDACRWIELPGERYNYTPKKPDEDVSSVSIVHYKGNRKHWMVEEAAKQAAKADGERVLQMLKEGSFGRRAA